MDREKRAGDRGGFFVTPTLALPHQGGGNRFFSPIKGEGIDFSPTRGEGEDGSWDVGRGVGTVAAMR